MVCGLSRRCTVRWKIIFYLVQFIASTTDLMTESRALHTFLNKSQGTAQDAEIEAYTYMWLAGCIIQGLLCLSQVILFISAWCDVGCDCYDWDRHDDSSCYSKWNKVNYILGFMFEDFMIGVAKLLIARQSYQAVYLLQDDFERIASIVAFSVNFLQLIITTVNVIIMFRRSKFPSGQQFYGVVCLVFSSIAFSTTFTAMLISTAAIAAVDILWVTILCAIVMFALLLGITLASARALLRD
ncbi:hypothetical protein EB796_015929 [Bugula neritina]|uniref:Uncharacterized protein n=1 Tax=Bugula neritina TaxID=10212 RepID=A0A7J7JJY3_BUGNE|nr:hypothetical protein EB796_015929 [Bugula neritina]